MTPHENGRMLSEEEYKKHVDIKDRKRARMRKAMEGANEALIEEGRTAGAKIHTGWKNIDSYFPYNPDSILHVEISPVADNNRKLRIAIRELDSARWEEERKLVSYGAEHQSVTRTILEPTLIPNGRSSIIKLLRAELPLPTR